MKRLQGFTLIELMVTLALIAIIAAVGFPGVQELAANNKLLTQTNNLLASFHQARSEALKRAEGMSVVAKGGDWADGWDVMIAASGTSIAEVAALPPGMEVKQNGSEDFDVSYTYNAQGRLNIDNNNELMFCDSRTGEPGRVLILSPMGRVSVDRVTCD